MTSTTERPNIQLPMDDVNANLRKVGRAIEQSTECHCEWRDGEYGFQATWPDGFSAWIGFGELASATIEAHNSGPKH